MRCPPRLGARGIGHVVGSCIMAAPAYASDTSGRDFQQFVDDVGRNRDFFISVASAAFAFGQLVAAFKASPEGKIQEALAQHATIIGGRYQSGKSVATEEALRGVRGVVRFTIRSADWADRMCKQLGVVTKGCSKRSCGECPRSSRTSPTTSPSFQSFFLKSLVQPPKDWLDKICFFSFLAML